jgi:hypothetical protein
MSKIEQPKYNLELTDISKYKLVRERDGLTNVGQQIRWIDWSEDGSFKEAHTEPAVGRSLILDPHPFQYTWLTTSITEILEQKENYIKFATKNSTYELWEKD